MDRQLIYPGQIPLETDLLGTNKNMMIALSKMCAAVLGTATQLNGLACAPNIPAALNVIVGNGEIYSLQNIDGTAYSSIAADTTHTILKQGILLDPVTLSCPAPATAGFSINYLVQVAYTDTDTNAVVLPYYNASNPSQAYSGPANAGTTNNTVRKGVCSVSVKAGIAATTGTQVTPAADAGSVGAYVVTVANGQATIVAGNIATVSGAPFISLPVRTADLAASTGAGLVGNGPLTLDVILKNSIGKVVTSIANLKAIDKTLYTQAFVAGYYAAGDGGGGAYWYDSTDTTTADNGGTVIVATDGGRWKLIPSRRIVDASQFGTIADGVADDTAKLQALFDNAPLILNGTIYEARVYIPAGTYMISAGIILPNTGSTKNIRWFIEGAGPLQTKIFQSVNGLPVFDVQEIVGSPGNQSVIENIGMSGPPGTGQAYVGPTAACILGRFALGWRIFNCWFTSMYYGIRFTTAGASPNIGSEELYVAWNVFEFIQNCVAVDGNSTSVATTDRSCSGNVATITTAAAHGLIAGQKIAVRGVGNIAYDQSNIQVLTVPTTTSFTYRIGAISSEGLTADTGGGVYWLNGRSLHITSNEFASCARTDIGGLGTDSAINLFAAETVQIFGNRYAYGVGKGIILTTCRDITISSEDFSMANESFNASLGAYGQTNITANNSIDVQINSGVLSTNISGPNVLLSGGSKVNLNGVTFSNVAGSAAVQASGAANELNMIGCNIDNVTTNVILVDSSSSLVNSRLSNNKVGATNAGVSLIKVTSGILASSVVVENNSPDSLWCAPQGKLVKSIPLSTSVSGTVPVATLNLIDFGAVIITLRVSGLSQGSGSAGHEIRYSLYRTTGTTTITEIGTATTYGSASGSAQMAAVTSGNQTQIQAAFTSASGFLGNVEMEVIGNISSVAMLY